MDERAKKVEYRIVSQDTGHVLESAGDYERACDGLRFFGREARMEQRTVTPWVPVPAEAEEGVGGE